MGFLGKGSEQTSQPLQTPCSDGRIGQKQVPARFRHSLGFPDFGDR